MRFLVLGAGAMGGYFGGRLLRGGADVTFLVRARRAAQLAARGLVVLAHDGEIRKPAKTVRAGNIDDTFDVVLLACKTYDLPDAMAAIEPALGPDSCVLPLLNGIGHLDKLADRFGRGRVLGGLTAVNAVLRDNGDVFQGPLKVELNVLGELDGTKSARCEAIRAAFAAGGTAFSVSDDIVARMWGKLFVFAPSAVVTTLTRGRAWQIAQAADGAAFVDAVLAECGAVCAAAGFAQEPAMAETVRDIFRQRESAYGPSILVDMLAGRLTEGDDTVGDLLRRGRAHGLDLPLLTAAMANLQAYDLARLAAAGGAVV